jgi:hypothetical protein
MSMRDELIAQIRAEAEGTSKDDANTILGTRMGLFHGEWESVGVGSAIEKFGIDLARYIEYSLASGEDRTQLSRAIYKAKHGSQPKAAEQAGRHRVDAPAEPDVVIDGPLNVDDEPTFQGQTQSEIATQLAPLVAGMSDMEVIDAALAEAEQTAQVEPALPTGFRFVCRHADHKRPVFGGKTDDQATAFRAAGDHNAKYHMTLDADA